ncbi:DEAD/DEAH box helicase, partial [Xanthovirga aplysinae]|uniref:DEAD/DEAH box helicase n=1 Tax=Xanthovirga aplysinae TaxID=2529853 RepID=UPI0012BCB766
MRNLLQYYLRRLTNLNANNRSLLLLRLISNQFIDIKSLDFHNSQPAFSLVEELIAGNKQINICPVQNSRDENSNLSSVQLKKLQRLERLIYEERGVRDLYVGWPFVSGQFMDGTLVRCPLIYFPVTLEQKDYFWVLKVRNEVNFSFNRSFLLAYAYYNKTPLSEDLLDEDFEGFSKDSRVFRTMLYQLLKESPIELNYNQDLFTDRLSPFQSHHKNDFINSTHVGQLKLFPEAVLGLFPQDGSQIAPDYMSLIENKQIKDIEEFFSNKSIKEDQTPFTGKPNSYHFLQRIKEEQLITPFPLDPYQENALKAVKKGNSIVVQGPPGTGKSQLICNLIADCNARGMRVLLVCQKRAALDVVYKRFEEEGMDDFFALIHDFKNDRPKLYQRIANQIENLNKYKQQNHSFDSIQLERAYIQSCRRIDQITEQLEAYKGALFDEKECGKSVKELYLSSNLEEPSCSLKQEYKFFHFDHLIRFKEKLKLSTIYSQRFNAANYPWKNRLPFQYHGINELQELTKTIERIPVFQKQINLQLNEQLQLPLSFLECESIIGNKEKIQKLISLIECPKIYEYFQFMTAHSKTSVPQIEEIERTFLDCYKGEGPELSLNQKEAGEFHQVLANQLERERNILKRIVWKYLSEERQWITEVCKANGLKTNKEDLDRLIEKIDNRLNISHNLSLLRRLKWIKDLPNINKKADVQRWFFQQRKAAEAKALFFELRNFKDYFSVPHLSLMQFREKLQKLIQILKDLPQEKRKWQKWLSNQQINFILEEKEAKQKYITTLNRDFEDLCAYDQLKSSLKDHEISTIKKIHEKGGTQDVQNCEQLFLNSLRLAWIAHIESKYPILRSVSSLQYQQHEKELQQLLLEKQDLCQKIFLLRSRERCWEDVEYNRLKNRVTYRDLHWQVSKKRKIWPLRKLIGEFSEELFRLIPCWMTSPETVSSIFPMESIFDVVIFDEASQCFAEKGIPAMYRGKQVVVSGDSQQLSPHELYQNRWEDSEQEFTNADHEVTSLLELANRHLMQIQLKRHYRSHSTELIEFSNQHFYKKQLKVIPSWHDHQKKDTVIKYIKTDGIWKNNTNEAEAQKVASLVIDLLPQEKDIGVVTFNAPQQEKILDVLEEKCKEMGISFPDSIFVKNIENVQGDEKDIIIFSVAYAPDANGRMAMHFGSLNSLGGENRLNVAITRARKKIFLVSSITPEQLKVDKTKHDGPKLLKKYLEYSWNVSQGHFKPSNPKEKRFESDWFLSHKLKLITDSLSIPTTLDHGLPFADLVLKNNKGQHALILTDDELYYQSISIKDPHALTPITLREKDWPFKKYNSRDYWQKPQ